MRQKQLLTKKEIAVTIGCAVLLMMSFCAIGGSSHQTAKLIICKSNLANIARAEFEYTEDNSGYFTDAMDWLHLSDYSAYTIGIRPSLSDDWRCRWHNEAEGIDARPELAGQLWPYLENRDVVMCPAFKSLAIVEGRNHLGHDPSVPMKPQHSYAQNSFIGPLDTFGGGMYDSMGGYIAPKVSSIAKPSDIFVFAAENFVPISIAYGYNFTWAVDAMNDTALFPWYGNLSQSDGMLLNPCDSIGSLHKRLDESIEAKEAGVCNAVFADGHVEQAHPWETAKYGSPKIEMKDSPH